MTSHQTHMAANQIKSSLKSQDDKEKTLGVLKSALEYTAERNEQ